MATRATVLMKTLHQTGNGTYALGCDFQIHDPAYQGAPSIVVGPFNDKTTDIEINQAIIDAINARVKSEGFTFDLLDTIEVLNVNKLSIV